jgi:hypothetical protein
MVARPNVWKFGLIGLSHRSVAGWYMCGVKPPFFVDLDEDGCHEMKGQWQVTSVNVRI